MIFKAIGSSTPLVVIALVTSVLTTEIPDAQTFRVSAHRLEIQSASVRRSQNPRREGPGEMSFLFSDYVWRGRSVTAKSLIHRAYTVQPWEIMAAPAWAANERFDLVVTYRDVSAVQEGLRNWSVLAVSERRQVLLESMQVILADLFQFEGAVSRVEAPVYALVPVANGGQQAARLRRAEIDCEAYLAALPDAVTIAGTTSEITCGSKLSVGELRSGGITMNALAVELSRQLGSSVVDQTRLQGHYEFLLRHSEVKPRSLYGPYVLDFKSLRAALEEQLGLTLEARRTPIEALVVHRLRRPRLDE